MNMTLATIDTKEKSDEITELLRNTFGNVNPVWIGAVANGDDRHYVWISTGKRVVFTNWYVDEPDFHNNNEYCLQTGWSNQIKWNDHECHLHFGLICEYTDHHDIQKEMHEKLQEEMAKQEELQKELDRNQLLLQLLLDYTKDRFHSEGTNKTIREIFLNIN
ncbi:Lectin subunit alpha [Lucilia cuprina]|nr:Lectin subunit alpha [Lucilia cuprina]